MSPRAQHSRTAPKCEAERSKLCDTGPWKFKEKTPEKILFQNEIKRSERKKKKSERKIKYEARAEMRETEETRGREREARAKTGGKLMKELLK